MKSNHPLALFHALHPNVRSAILWAARSYKLPVATVLKSTLQVAAEKILSAGWESKVEIAFVRLPEGFFRFPVDDDAATQLLQYLKVSAKTARMIREASTVRPIHEVVAILISRFARELSERYQEAIIDPQVRRMMVG